MAVGPLPTARAAATRPQAGGALQVTKPAVEYARQPLGLDIARPRLSWPLIASGQGQQQTAYQIRVATSPGKLTTPDVWDSGKVDSDQSVLVPYAGPELKPRTRYHWSTRSWDAEGNASGWSSPSWWETGLMSSDQWRARWISAPAELTNAPSLKESSWIWYDEGNPAQSAPAATRWFRRTFEVADEVSAAELAIAADDGHTVYVNGTKVGQADIEPDTDFDMAHWRRPSLIDVRSQLRQGTNVLAVAAVNATEGPAGLIARLDVTTGEGETKVVTDDSWKSTNDKPDGRWQRPDYDDGDWSRAKIAAAWGADPWGEVVPVRLPASQLRHEFRLADKPVARARLYATALGVYEAHLNGERVGEDVLAPGWTDYQARVQYQTYDVTEQVRAGANAIGVALAPGWYAGYVGMFGPHQYGKTPAFLGQLEVSYEDGTTTRVTSGTDWRATGGPVRHADLLMGEDYDARAETPGWTAPGYDASDWLDVQEAKDVKVAPVAQVDAPSQVMTELPAKKVTEPKPGVFVFDLGQNMVGAARLHVRGKAGTTVRLRHAEVLNPDGTLYTANLRTARATDTYVLKGEGRETFEPRFTFHGFRYVEVTGYPGRPPKTAVTGRVIHTAAPFTLDFETNVPMLNTLHRNITWGQRGNFLSVPTDTPARDERLGWTGDINVFAPTAAYTMESARFLSKWLIDLRDAQRKDGAFTDVAPQGDWLGEGVAGWGDAGVTVPWALYQAYGDVRVLRQSWQSMVDWLDYLEAHSEGLLRPASGYGDWLNVQDETPKDVIATAYFAHSADLTARVAKVLGKDPKPYRNLFERVREAFQRAYVTQDGARVKGDTQTAYVLALSMDLLPKPARKAAANRLVDLVRNRGWHLSTGFLGTPRLLPVLTETGHQDVAYRLLHQPEFPGWGYQIDKGATTMWEHWDSLKPDGSFQRASMNSFNHYAYGAVGEWMYANIAGIAPGEPGFRHTVIRPRPGGEVTSARATFTSLYGPISTDWKQNGDRFRLTCSLPPNCTAEVWIRADDAAAVRHPEGARLDRAEDGWVIYQVGTGTHRFSV